MSTNRATAGLGMILASASAALLTAACMTVGPDYEPPAAALPETWHEPEQSVLTSGTADLAGWWHHLGDPLLDELVARATRQSLDLREAFARVREARALRGVASSEQYPTVDGTLRFTRTGQSENTVFGAFVPDANEYSAGFDAAWELDLWGRVRRSVEAADADLATTIEDARDVLVTVAAEVALSYVDLRAFQHRLAIARDNLSLQEQTLDLVRGRFEAGLVGEGDVAQARTNLETTRSALPAFEIGLRAAENRLAVLLGQPPGTLADELASEAPIPVPPLAVAVGVPADLLRRRADVRRAERALAAETARIGVAEGDLYPRLALFGNLGLAAEEASDLFKQSSAIFGIGPSLRWNLFDAGRLRQLVAAKEARTDQALARWERTVLGALEESENAMTSFVREQARRASLLEAASQARLAVDFARTQYTEGLSDFQNVLVSERSLAVLEDDLATSDAAIAVNLIRLYKSLGGGWDEGELAVAATF
jgi:NodT family efflux transporter outer membrane factor (OMF) lipoprotein